MRSIRGFIRSSQDEQLDPPPKVGGGDDYQQNPVAEPVVILKAIAPVQETPSELMVVSSCLCVVLAADHPLVLDHAFYMVTILGGNLRNDAGRKARSEAHPVRDQQFGTTRTSRSPRQATCRLCRLGGPCDRGQCGPSLVARQLLDSWAS